MDIEQLKADVAAGKLSQDKLLTVIVAQRKRIAELEELVRAKNAAASVDELYSNRWHWLNLKSNLFQPQS